MALEPNMMVDGWTNFAGGVDSDDNPTALDKNKLSFAGNISLRGTYAETRPGFPKLGLIYGNSEIRDWIDDHNIQGALPYTPKEGDSYLIFSSGGRLFRCMTENDYRVFEITPQKATTLVADIVSPAVGSTVEAEVTDSNGIFSGYPVRIGSGTFRVSTKVGTALTLENINMTPGLAIDADSPVLYLDANTTTAERVYWAIVEGDVVMQDWRSKPWIYNGSTTRRAESDEIPVGGPMAYWKGRLWIAISEQEYIASDIAGGPTGVYKVTENNLLQGGGKFKIPDAAGKINGMVIMPNLDVTLGQGPLQIVCRKMFFSVNAPADRDAWATVTDPIQTVSLVHAGALSQSGIALVNGDIFFRSRDGIRSFAMARRETGEWGQTPISGEMDRALADDDPKLARYASMVVFDNRLLTTFRFVPEYEKNAVYATGILPLNFDPTSKMGVKQAPVWEGIWQGISPYLLVAGEFNDTERCFAMCRNSDGEFELWEISRNAAFDGEEDRVVSWIETGSAVFKSLFVLGRLTNAEIWYDRVIGTVDFTLDYRPDQYPCWFDWPADKQVCSKYRDCTQELEDCNLSPNFKPGYRTRQRWGNPPEEDENFDEKPAPVCYEAQVRLQWTGHARIKAILVKAVQVQEEAHAGDLD